MTPTQPSPPAGREHHVRRMDRQAWALFAAMAVIWGIPYMFVKVAVEQISPASLVLGRTASAVVILLPVAAWTGTLRPALRHWRLVAVFAAMEMGLPWLLLGHAEQRISSGLAGLMIAMVPIVGAVVTAALGDRHNVARARLAGMAVGVLGVGALVGVDSVSGQLDLLSVAEMFVIAVCYAVAPIVIDRRAADVPAMGIIALAVLMVAIAYLPVGLPQALAVRPLQTDTLVSVLMLGLVCTALAFVLFFRLIAVAGPVRAVVFTFINPAVAILLGIVVLGESVTTGMLVGFPLVLLGSWLATRPAADA